MGLLYLHHSGVWGGGTLSCFDVTEVLMDEYQIELAFPTGNNVAKKYAENNKIPYVDSPDMAVFRYYSGGPSFVKVVGSYFKTYENKKKWTDYMHGKKYDAVLLNSIVLWPMLKVFNQLDIPTILFIRETQKGKKNSIINSVIRMNINKYATAVSFLSKYDKEQWGFSEHVQQFIIPDVVNVKKFEENSKKLSICDVFGTKNDEIFRVLFAGGISSLKGTLVALKAMKRVNSKARLYILGDCSLDILSKNVWIKLSRLKTYLYAVRVTKILNDPEISERVFMVGTVTDMSRWYSFCDVCIIPITKPHQSRSIFEAGVFRKPVIITDFKNYSEYVKNNINGLTFTNESSEALADRINKMIVSNEMIQELGALNREFTMKYHSLTSVRPSVLEMMNCVVNSGVTRYKKSSPNQGKF